MLLRGSIAALAFALSAFSGSPGARADEAYICDAGRVVYVKMGELEAMKHSDPCIASYYGITLPQPSPVAPVPVPTVAPVPVSPAPVPPAAAARAPVELKTLEAPEQQAGNAAFGPLKLATADVESAHHRAPPVASPGTDFRNVRLINAAPGSDGWYRHKQ